MNQIEFIESKLSSKAQKIYDQLENLRQQVFDKLMCPKKYMTVPIPRDTVMNAFIYKQYWLYKQTIENPTYQAIIKEMVRIRGTAFQVSYKQILKINEQEGEIK